MKEVYTVGQNSQTRKFFIMGNHGQVKDTPYFNTYKDCMVEILEMKRSIYDLSDKNYSKYLKGD